MLSHFKYSKAVQLVIILSLSYFNCHGNGETSDFIYCMNQIKKISGCMYDYTLTVSFPDSTKESVSGQSYLNTEKTFSYNSNSIATILFDGNWYYHANHTKKVVTIYQLEKQFDSETVTNLRNEAFQMDMYDEWVDSVVLKYGHVNAISKINGILKFEIMFNPNSFLRRIGIVFDLKSNQLKRCEVESYFGSDGNLDTKQMAIQTMICTNYRKSPDADLIELERYFQHSSDGKKIKLIKYKNYKLLTSK